MEKGGEKEEMEGRGKELGLGLGWGHIERVLHIVPVLEILEKLEEVLNVVVHALE